MKIAFFDFEMSNLAADFGIVLCGFVKELGNKVQGFSLSDFGDDWRHLRDKRLCVALRNELEKFDIIIGYNSSRFDIPFLNSRLLLQGLRPLRPTKHIDLLYTSRFKLRLHSNRLDSVSQYFQTKGKKTPLDGRIWVKAMAGDPAALRHVSRHCIADVVVLEEVYERMKSQIKEIKTR